MRYFVRADGSYLGGFGVPDAALAELLPADAVEVPGPPADASDRWDGSRFVPDLDLLKARRKAEVDAAAEQERLRYITPGSGQQGVYLRKAQEAEACLAGGAGPFPLLEASVGIEAETVEGVAQIVAAITAQWTQAAAAIEAKRLGAKKAIDEAGTPEAVEAAAIIDWMEPA